MSPTRVLTLSRPATETWSKAYAYGYGAQIKDVIVRTQQMAGKDSIYVPGWDCHGLPIEWKIEEGYR